MPDLRDPRVDTFGAADDIQQMRSRIGELEDQLRSRPTEARNPRPDRAAKKLLRALAAALAAMTVLTAPLAFITVRRWHRWWQV